MRSHQLGYWERRYYQTEAAGAATGTDDKKGADDTESIDYYKAEAKKAFKDRDATAKKLRDLEGRVLSEDDLKLFQTLKTEREQLEEDRKKKSGEFDSLRQQLVEKHAKELDAEKKASATIRERFRYNVKRAEFGAATEWFGGETAKTIFDPDMAMDVLGKYVHVEDVEDDPMGYRVVVKRPTGETILGDDGRPAPFAAAIKDLIAGLPNRDRMLRGSGKTGSGSAGSGTADRGTRDLDHPSAEDFNDPKVRAEIRKRSAKAGGLVIGKAWDKLAK